MEDSRTEQKEKLADVQGGQQQDVLEGDFLVLEALSAEEEGRIREQRVKELRQFYSTNKPYQITSWYQALQPFTFKSSSIQLSAIDAYLLFWLYYNDHDLLKMQHKHQKLYQYYQAFIQKIHPFLLSKSKQFSKQGQQFSKQPQQFSKQGPVQCFMKLATRSPKDLGYKYSHQQIQSVSQKLTSYLKANHSHQINHPKQTLSLDFVNSIYRFFLDLSKQKFKITSAQNFIDIFSSSERIIIDLSDFSFIYKDVFSQFEKDEFSRAEQPFIELWARQWRDFQWYQELRCFYHNYELTAITQYDQRCFFKELQNKEEIIKNQVQNFFTSLKPQLQKLSLSQGVMDLVIFNLDNGPKIETKLIQINVFNRNSRASLFSWERDLEILTGLTSQKPQLRILASPKQIYKDEVKRLMGMIEKGTDQIISKSLDSLGLKKNWQKLQ